MSPDRCVRSGVYRGTRDVGGSSTSPGEALDGHTRSRRADRRRRPWSSCSHIGVAGGGAEADADLRPSEARCGHVRGRQDRRGQRLSRPRPRPSKPPGCRSRRCRRRTSRSGSEGRRAVGVGGVGEGRHLDGRIAPHRFIEGRCGPIVVLERSTARGRAGPLRLFVRLVLRRNFSSHISLFPQRGGPGADGHN